MHATVAVMNTIPAQAIQSAEIKPGTLFEQLPDEWTCPACGEEKDVFIEI